MLLCIFFTQIFRRVVAERDNNDLNASMTAKSVGIGSSSSSSAGSVRDRKSSASL